MSLTRSVAKGAEAQFSITKIGHLDSKGVFDIQPEASSAHRPSPGQPEPVRIGARCIIWLPVPNGPGPDESVFDITHASTAMTN